MKIKSWSFPVKRTEQFKKYVNFGYPQSVHVENVKVSSRYEDTGP